MDRLAGRNVDYTAMFVDVNNGRISADAKEITFDFEIMLCDLADVSVDAKQNEIEVLSDLSSIAADYKAMISFSDYLEDWEIDDVAGLRFLKEESEDIVLAVLMSISVSTAFDNNRCDVPADGVSFETPQNNSIVNNYTYKGNGTEGTTLIVTALQNRIPLFVLKGNNPLMRVYVDPADVTPEQFTFDPATTEFKFGNDIEDQQVIQILYR